MTRKQQTDLFAKWMFEAICYCTTAFPTGKANSQQAEIGINQTRPDWATDEDCHKATEMLILYCLNTDRRAATRN